MNNRHLYKAKRMDNGEWVRGYFWIGNDHAYIIPSNIGIAYDDERNELTAYAVEVDPSTLCQCTGLTDKNDKLIWENDIVEATGRVFGMVRFGKYGDTETDYGFYIEWDKTQLYWRNDFGYWRKDIKVIGNIFDNPELMEVGE